MAGPCGHGENFFQQAIIRRRFYNYENNKMYFIRGLSNLKEELSSENKY